METYGVNFDGFEPSCGWPMYKHTEEELIPNLMAEVERWRTRRDEAAKELKALKGLKDDLDGMSKSRDSLVGKLQAKISGGGSRVNDVMPLGVKEAKVKVHGSWQALSSWLNASKSSIKKLAFFYKYACERADYNLGFLIIWWSRQRSIFAFGSAHLNCSVVTGCLRRPSSNTRLRFVASS